MPLTTAQLPSLLGQSEPDYGSDCDGVPLTTDHTHTQNTQIYYYYALLKRSVSWSIGKSLAQTRPLSAKTCVKYGLIPTSLLTPYTHFISQNSTVAACICNCILILHRMGCYLYVFGMLGTHNNQKKVQTTYRVSHAQRHKVPHQ